MKRLVVAALAAAALAAGSLSSSAATPARKAAPLRVLSLNVAGIPLVHPRLAARLRAIGERLDCDRYDVVALQEVWFSRDARRLAEAAGLLHSARSPQAWPFGDGLLIVSRFPIQESKSLRFSRRTNCLLCLDGEGLAHKGALLARIETLGGELDVYNVHLVADYKKYAYREVRLSQVTELLTWIGRLSAGRPVVIAGDLNMTRSDPAYALLAQRLGLQDACDLPGGDACAPSREKNRIDHILVPAGSTRALEAAVAFHETLEEGGKRVPLSDHLGLVVGLATLPAALAPGEAVSVQDRVVSGGRP